MKRQRPILSCTYCRDRRVRCDKAKPACGRCIAAGRTCTYTDTNQATPLTQDDEEMLASGHESEQTEYRTTATAQPISTSAAAEPSRTVPHIEDGTLIEDGEGRSQYFGPTFWANTILSGSPAEARNPRSAGQQPRWAQHSRPDSSIWRRVIASDKFTSSLDSGICSVCGNPASLYCCLALLPSRSICHKLCGAFFLNVYPLIPILHVPSVEKDYEAFWNNFQQRGGHDLTIGPFLREKPDFLCLLCAMMFAGLSTLPQNQREILLGNSSLGLIDDLYFATMKSASLVGFPRRPSLYSLASYVIAEMQLLREEDFPDPPTHVTTSFRVALGMGLHIDSHRFSFPVAEIRRRLWWFIVHLDVMISASSGLSPLFIDEKMSNVTMICRQDSGPEDLNFQINDGDVRYAVARYRYSISKALRVIIRDQFEGNLLNEDELTNGIKNLSSLVNEIFTAIALLLPPSSNLETNSALHEMASQLLVENMPETMKHKWTLISRTSDAVVGNFCSWSALLLHLMIHKVYCVLYHPFMRKIVAVSTRIRALKHAQSFLLLFIIICTNTKSFRFHWMYPGIYQPLQPLAVLLTDVLRYPYSDEAYLSRGLIDSVFDLYRVDHGVVSEELSPARSLSAFGKDAWWMLIRARTKALEAVGQDPHVLLPYRMVAGQRCLCGNSLEAKTDQGSANTPSFNSDYFDPPHTNPNRLMDQAQEPFGFSWEEWDALIGDGAGFMA